MKLNYKLSNLAESDLENIWKYTYENWSQHQADKYIHQIIAEIEIISSMPEKGKHILDIKSDHRMVKINAHLIIYKFDKKELKVDRVLHEKMDIKNRI